MIKIENVEVIGWEAAIRGMRNPMNSWKKSDSLFYETEDFDPDDYPYRFKLGKNDHDLMMKLVKGGPVHAKYRRMITVYLDITAPLYWWKEFDTYKIGTVANSCSTMHKIAEKEFTVDDFSCEHLLQSTSLDVRYTASDGFEDIAALNSYYTVLNLIVKTLNCARNLYNNEPDNYMKKMYWWQMIQLLPSSYNQKRTVMLNYEVLANIYHSRKNHKLDEWRTLCNWIESLPYSELIVGEP